MGEAVARQFWFFPSPSAGEIEVGEGEGEMDNVYVLGRAAA